jgi:ribosomal protein S12 methylthiotransferase
VPDEVKEERQARFMAAQEAISERRLRGKIGQTLEVLIDEVDGNRAIGRSGADAPDIDGVVHVQNARKLQPGDLVKVTVNRADVHDLYGKLAV